MESDESSGLESKKTSHNTLMALIKFLQKKRFNIVEKAAAEVTEEVVSDAVGVHIISYGTSRHKKSVKAGNEKFTLLLSTKGGGHKINRVDTRIVVLYDGETGCR
ncbi:hypothetical protein POM88_039314 [Heracleum sosnowskyi]|uniref:Uncharacterized protein n=1 Tax=Heracleum sosnowskyi TaxID=360622 RepID=A0AAD8M983_9APIA|nr:hypothetical protein POM88_039314 [Heracleum sosnowskyi]